MRLAIMQGRLVPSEPDRFQSFPRARWRDEFAIARQVGLDAIEWIYDGYGETDNPIATEPGAAEFRQLQQAYGIAVASCCADWFMDYPLTDPEASLRPARWQRLRWLVDRCQALAIERIVIPLVDASAICSAQDRADVVAGLRALRAHLDVSGVELHLETALPAGEFATLLDAIDHPSIKINYDIGNSAALGYDPVEEFAAYGHRIGSVHIKDRALGAGTVPLGRGDARFETVFRGLRAARYTGDFVLQVARGVQGDELAWTRDNLALVRGYLASWFTL